MGNSEPIRNKQGIHMIGSLEWDFRAWEEEGKYFHKAVEAQGCESQRQVKLAKACFKSGSEEKWPWRWETAYIHRNWLTKYIKGLGARILILRRNGRKTQKRNLRYQIKIRNVSMKSCHTIFKERHRIHPKRTYNLPQANCSSRKEVLTKCMHPCPPTHTHTHLHTHTSTQALRTWK